MFHTIVTHPGKAHRDEFLAACLLLGAYPEIGTICRQEPTPDDMVDPEVLVLDIGGEYSPSKGNYDHHQFARDAPPTCSLSLILPLLGCGGKEKVKKLWSWLEWSEWMDSKGPNQTASHYELDPEILSVIGSPIESSLLRIFERRELITRLVDPLGLIMADIGNQLLTRYRAIDERLAILAEKVSWVTEGCVVICDTTGLAELEQPTLGLEIHLRDVAADCAVVVSRDDRGPGFSLFRRNDDARVDFSLVTEHPEVTFAHKGGFIAKTAATADWREIVKKAIVKTAAE